MFTSRQGLASKKTDKEKEEQDKKVAEEKEKKQKEVIKSYTDKFQIITRRLFEGKIQDLDLFIEEMSDEDNSEFKADSLFQKEDDEFTGLDGTGGAGQNQYAGFYRKKKQILEVLKERTTPGSIINLQITGNILFLTLLIVAGVEFFITDQEFKQVRNNVGLIDL